MRNLTKVFKALSDQNRIRILKMLEIRPLCVCEITEILKLAASTVSKHLSLLRDAEFITDEKDAKWVIYNLNQKKGIYVKHLLPLINEWLPDDETVVEDRRKVESVDRNNLCGISKRDD